MANVNAKAKSIIARCRLPGPSELFAIGTFDDRVTVLTQQKRALNLAWALIEEGVVPTTGTERLRIAVIGGGFAGITFAAALVQKQAHCSISLFEERDTLLPLQQGSDTRWLHPHIYDWPKEGSEAVAAMLPVLSWTAARASDVVVQVLQGWGDLVTERRHANLAMWCNTRHLKLHAAAGNKSRLEWVGERRDRSTGQLATSPRNAEGRSGTFDLVVIAVGFGLEARGSSYWRNEVLGQPGLEQRSTSYLVSGQGDGAMIDLLRLKISQFRQDRILAELFGGAPELVETLRDLRRRFLEETTPLSLYDEFDKLARPGRKDLGGQQMRNAQTALAKRLRRDTEVVLQTRPTTRSIDDLLRSGAFKGSFQNALLVYLLYRCGGFAPAAGELDEIAERFKVPGTHIIERHGTDRLAALKRILPAPVLADLKAAWEADRCQCYRQDATIAWEGGYFGTPGRAADFSSLGDVEKAVARKEYLPGPTALLATAIASAVAAYLRNLKPSASHLRVTVHRVITIHDEDLLQQACDYFGFGESDAKPTAGRAFPASNATIGLAYRTRAIVRSAASITHVRLGKAMKVLNLNEASRTMARSVSFVAAIPVLQPENNFYEPSPVSAVVYFDSRDPNFDLDLANFSTLSAIIAGIVAGAQQALGHSLDRLDNAPLRAISALAHPPEALPADILADMVIVTTPPPTLTAPLMINLDHSDLTPIAH